MSRDASRSDPALAPTPRPRRRGLPPTVAALIAGIVAAGLSGTASETFVGLFAPAEKAGAPADPSLDPDDGEQRTPEERRGLVLDATLTYAVQGALLGLLLGLAGGASGGSVPTAGLGAGIGGMVGAIVCGLGAFGLFTVYVNHVDPVAPQLLAPLSTRSILWGVMGGVGGLAFGVGLGDENSLGGTILGGATGGLLAALLYELGGLMLGPDARPILPLAGEPRARLFAHGLIGVLVALGAVRGLSDAPEASTDST
ncbi:hypothetical protein [Tautonia rosea]|uniref:hypothetical protein n=1 Tax=Tautonia rosea TaxID=2728037 RepID=UPI001475F34B|nr:hypothetical protein [Tautonia rosea]